MFLAVCGLLHAQLPAPSIPAPAPAQNALPNGAARVIELTGMVSWVHDGDLMILQQNGIVKPGEEIVTGADGHAILQVQDGSYVEVFANSRFIFRVNRFNLTDLLDLMLGKVRVHIEKFGGRPNPYKMSSPTALIAVKGTTFDVDVLPNDVTTVSVEEGAVDVSHRLKTGSVTLTPGESVTVYPDRPLAQEKVNHMPAIIRGATQAVRIAEDIMILRGPRTTTPGTVPAATSTTTVTTGSSGSGNTGSPPSNRPGAPSNGDNGSPSPAPPSGGTGSAGGGRMPSPKPGPGQ